ncbi:hypothetical protein ABZP36_002425 [Zizania latifolia]
MGGKSRSNGRRRAGNGVATEAAAAARSTATTVVVALVFLLLVASLLVFQRHLLSPKLADGEGPREPVELAIGIAGHESWFNALLAWAKLACLKLRPPEPRYDLRSPASVKKAAKKSLEMGKETVEHAAESAARAAKSALGKTTVKLKRRVSPSSPRLDGDL